MVTTALWAAPEAWAVTVTRPSDLPPRLLAVMPQDDVLPATLEAIYLNKEDIDQAMVVVEMGQGEDNPRWLMSSTQMQVLIDTLLQFMPNQSQLEDSIWPKLKPVEPKYRGLRVVLRTVFGKHFEPFTVFQGKVMAANGSMMVPDYGRRLEYWMFGTSRVRRDQMVGANVLPVLTFEQCRLLGQQIVETKPRQCLLPNNNLLLETDELPTLQSAKIKDFEGCLKNGKALIYTFPRRCISAGGRVFTEPPKVYEALVPTPVDAPLIAPSAISAPPAMLPSNNGVNGSDLPPPNGGLLNSQLMGPIPSPNAGGAAPAGSGTPLTPEK